jgi:hypothetical protein
MKKVIETIKTHSMDIETVKACSICSEWVTYCVSMPKEDSEQTVIENFFNGKQDFWDKNAEHLKNHGYTYDASITKALDFVSCEKVNDLEGCLLIFRIGSNECPAPPSEIKNAYAMISQALDGVKGVRVIITNHKFTIEKISLPQLRRLQSSVLSSVDADDTENSIIRDLEI